VANGCDNTMFGCSIGMLGEENVGGRWRDIASIGVGCIEIGIDTIDMPDSDIADLRKSVEDAGLRVWSVHSMFGAQYSISSPDSDIRANGVKWIAGAARVAHSLGAGIVVVHSGDSQPDDQSDEEAEALAVASMKEVLTVCDGLPVRFAIENLPSGYINSTAESLMRVVSQLPEDRVGVCFDSGHAHITGEDEAIVEQASARVITTHLHDNDGNGDQHYLPGIGSVDWEAACRALSASTWDGPLMFEVGGPGSHEEALSKLPVAAMVLWGHFEG
jgi:sugar phosphate isomerase/epimerase